MTTNEGPINNGTVISFILPIVGTFGISSVKDAINQIEKDTQKEQKSTIEPRLVEEPQSFNQEIVPPSETTASIYKPKYYSIATNSQSTISDNNGSWIDTKEQSTTFDGSNNKGMTKILTNPSFPKLNPSDAVNEGSGTYDNDISYSANINPVPNIYSGASLVRPRGAGTNYTH